MNQNRGLKPPGTSGIDSDASHPPTGRSAREVKKKFQNRLQDRFWADLGLKFGFCVKNCIGASVQTNISSFFENLVFHLSGFGIFTFDRYFETWEHQNRTQLEKISQGSFFQIFLSDGKLIGAWRRSKLGCAAPLCSPQSDLGGRGSRSAAPGR